MGNVVARKTVNALIPEAEMDFAAKFILDMTGAGEVLEVGKRRITGNRIMVKSTTKRNTTCL